MYVKIVLNQLTITWHFCDIYQESVMRINRSVRIKKLIKSCQNEDEQSYEHKNMSYVYISSNVNT